MLEVKLFREENMLGDKDVDANVDGDDAGAYESGANANADANGDADTRRLISTVMSFYTGWW